MGHRPTCNWKGASGTGYKFFIHPLPASFSEDQSGNYIYSRKNDQGLWVPIYIGEGDLKVRSEKHHKVGCIKAKGATHIHVHLHANEETRRAEETDLLARYTNAYAPSGCNEKPGG